MNEETIFRKQLAGLINCHSRENRSDTPDFILATYMASCLDAFDVATRSRDEWYIKSKIDEPPGRPDLHAIPLRHLTSHLSPRKSSLMSTQTSSGGWKDAGNTNTSRISHAS